MLLLSLIVLSLSSSLKAQDRLESEILLSKFGIPNFKNNLRKDKDQAVINVSDYNYPVPEKEEEGIYTIAILGTSDIHGYAFKEESFHPGTKQQYSSGGINYLASYIKILQGQWGDRLLWLDGGDQFQGGFETKLSNGEVMTEFFNKLNIQSSAIGNHEFDFGQEFLKTRINKAHYEYLASNIENDLHEKAFIDHMKTSSVHQVGQIKVGVIGLATLETTITTAGDLTGFNFLDYVPSIISESKKLKKQSVDVILLTSHIGTVCKNLDINENKLRYYKPEVEEECNIQKEEMNKLIEKLVKEEEKDGVTYLHGIVAGHTHSNTHHYIKGKPVVSTGMAGRYFNIMYLKFKKIGDSYQLMKEDTVIEGPVPVCEKLFENTKTCYGIDDNDSTVGTLRNFTFHKKQVFSDTSIKAILDKLHEKMKPYEEVIATTDIRLKMNWKEGDSQLANIYTDCIREGSGADFSTTNNGGFRVEWAPGKIRKVDLYNMFPFGSKVIKFHIEGWKVKKLMKTIQEGSKALYPISGMQVLINSTYGPKIHGPIFDVLETRISEDQAIEDGRLYSFITNSFLLPGYGDDFSLVKDWLNPVEITEEGIDKDILETCLRKIKNITPQTHVEKQRLIITKEDNQ